LLAIQQVNDKLTVFTVVFFEMSALSDLIKPKFHFPEVLLISGYHQEMVFQMPDYQASEIFSNTYCLLQQRDSQNTLKLLIY
jgi:hypothetical protein